MKKFTKHTLSIILTLCLVLSYFTIADCQVQAASYGSGGKFLAPIDSPVSGSIPISDINGLLAIKNNLIGKYHLTQDIEWPQNMTWMPIGSVDSPFRGIFDGQGHIIKNLKIVSEGMSSGLFAYANGNADIKNVGLEDTIINITVGSEAYSEVHDGIIGYVGGIVGYCAAGIKNCFNSGGSMIVSAQADRYGPWNHTYVGGVVGYSGYDIMNCYNTGTIDASFSGYSVQGLPMGVRINTYTGGIAGGIADVGTINNCYNEADITVSASANGDNYSSAINFAYVGGICAENYGIISNCYNTGFHEITVSGNKNPYSLAGGICAENWGTIRNCYNTESISANVVGGICCTNSGIISYSYNTGDIIGESGDIGAICASNNSGGTIPNCYWNIDSRQTVNGVIRTNSNKKGVGNDMYYTPSLTTTQMKQQSSFTGFNFTEIWAFISGVNNGYPVLLAFYQSAASYTVSASVNDSTYGTVSANPTTAAQGDIITLSASALSGYEFDCWQVLSGSVSISDPYSPNASFKMPDEDVSLKANFKQALLTTTPTITMQPVNQNITVGQNATFTVVASGNPTPTYQWQVNTDAVWSNISGATNATLTLTNTTTNQSGNQYRCVVTNSAGSVISNAATLSVITDSEPIIKVSSAMGKVGSDSVTVQILAENSPLLGSLKFNVNYPDSLTLIGATVPIGSGFETVVPVNLNSGVLFAFNSTGTDSFDANGIVLNLTFAIDKDANLGKYSITLSEIKAKTEDDQDVVLLTLPGTITVANIIYGDFTSNGEVDGTDILWLRRYIASGENLTVMRQNFPTSISTFNESAGDFTNNGDIDGTDILWMRRYIASGNNVATMLNNFSTTINFGHLGTITPTAFHAANIFALNSETETNLVTLTSSEKTVAQGDTFTITVGLNLIQSENISAFAFALDYDDSILRLVPGETQYLGAFEAIITSHSGGDVIRFTPKTENPHRESGKIAVFTFEVLDASKSAAVGITIDRARNEDDMTVTLLVPAPMIINLQIQDISTRVETEDELFEAILNGEINITITDSFILSEVKIPDSVTVEILNNVTLTVNGDLTIEGTINVEGTIVINAPTVVNGRIVIGTKNNDKK